jgi:hypothetical protein
MDPVTWLALGVLIGLGVGFAINAGYTLMLERRLSACRRELRDMGYSAAVLSIAVERKREQLRKTLTEIRADIVECVDDELTMLGRNMPCPGAIAATKKIDAALAGRRKG